MTDHSTRFGHCSGCTDPSSEGTHQMGTIEHPEVSMKNIAAEVDRINARNHMNEAMMVVQKSKREPLLSDDIIEDASDGSEVGFWYQHEGRSVPDMPATFTYGAKYARGAYEDMITRGEIEVVKVADVIQKAFVETAAYFGPVRYTAGSCSICGSQVFGKSAKRCMECGAKFKR